MPGICGILSLRPQQQNEAELDSMIAALRHESFHRAGKYTAANAGLYAGWVSLQGTFSGTMPVWNEKRNCLLLFYGRHFFDKEDVTALKRQNHQVRELDASLLIHLYEEKGPDFLRDLNGIYCGLIFDLVRMKGFVFNDRYGLERLYYHQSRDAFYFASEAKALIRVLPELAAVSPRSVGELACCDCVLDNRTLFDQISLLPAGSFWSFESGRVTERSSYFSAAEWEEQTLLGEDYFCGRVHEMLARITPRYFRSENPCAIALSGGVGSRLILGSSELPQSKVPCYTFDGMYRESLDVKWSRSLAKAVCQTHHVFKLDEGFLKQFPRYAEKAVYLSDGSSLVSAAAELYLTGRAREIAPVAISGRFVAQTLKGPRQLRAAAPEATLFQPEFATVFEELQQRFAKPLQHPLSAALFEELPWLLHGRLRVEQSQVEICTPFLDKDMLGLLFRAPDEAIRGERLPLKLLARVSGPMAALLSDLGYSRGRGGLRRTSRGARMAFLHRVDQACSGTAPSLRNQFLSFHHIPGLERATIGYGTYAHFRVWYRQQLAGYAKEVLLDPGSLARPYLRPKRVEHLLRQHTNGLADYTKEISLLLTLELVYRLFVDDAGSRREPNYHTARGLDPATSS